MTNPPAPPDPSPAPPLGTIPPPPLGTIPPPPLGTIPPPPLGTIPPPPLGTIPPPPPTVRPGRPRRMSRTRRRLVAGLGVLAFLAVPAIAGYVVGAHDGGAGRASATSTAGPESPTRPSGGSSGASGAPSSADLESLAANAADVVVNITSKVEGGGEAAGTGIVISGNGLVLTNNHVIAGTTGLTVELVSTGVTRPARVLGYSVVDDVAVIQVQNVRDLTAARIGSSSSLAVGDTVVALGNAGGRGGTPSVVAGTVTALDREITASDPDGTNTQTLDGLIELAADIRSGDSGGPVVATDGTVVGMNVAASVSNSFGFSGRSGAGEGYAIPIEDAIAIAKKITSGEGGPDIRVGATRAVLGVQVQPQLSASRGPGGGGSGADAGGARVVGVEPGSGADAAGLRAGDTIVAIGGRTITSTNDLTRAMVPYGPGEEVEVTWRDADGRTRRAPVELGEGPPA